MSPIRKVLADGDEQVPEREQSASTPTPESAPSEGAQEQTAQESVTLTGSLGFDTQAAFADLDEKLKAAEAAAAQRAAEAEARQQIEEAQRDEQEALRQAKAARPSAKPVVEHVVEPGDTLSGIADKYYNNAGRWPEIYEANKDIIGDNPNLILVGQKLVIP